MTTVAVLGAGGKMGYRVTEHLAASDFEVRPVDISDTGRARIAELELEAMGEDVALDGADAVVLAIPDTLIGKVAREVFPKLAGGTMAIILDAAAPYAGELPDDRPDLTYFIVHPCHPPLFNDETDPEARNDHMGGIAAQSIVCALMQGPEEHYALGESISKAMYQPLLRCHRVTTEQLAILEPGLSEMVALSCVEVLRQALEECERIGVPREAAYDFLMGHLNVEIAMNFGAMPNVPSDGAKLILEWSLPRIFKDDWKKLLQPEQVREAVRVICAGRM